MKKSTRMVSLILAGVMVLLTACSSGGTSSGGSGSGNTGTEPKTSVVSTLQVLPSSLDTTKTSDLSSIMFQIHEGLVIDLDNKIQPALAESWEVSDDATTITFHLRSGITFHNGDPVTADDVVFSVNRAAASPFVTIMAGAIDKAEKIDDTTVKVTFKYPYGPGLKCFTTSALFIMPEALIEADEDGYGQNPVGAGPYKVKELVPGEKCVLEAYEGYYEGVPEIKEVTFRIINDTTTALIALEKGELDTMDSNIPEEAREELMNNKDLQYAEGESNAFLAIMFNNKSGPFADKRVREAVSYAVNRQEVIDGAKNGMATLLEAPLLTSCPEYPTDFKANPLDIEKAKELLTQAGYPNGFSCTMKTVDSPTYSKPTEIIQAQLKKIGIDVQIEIMERNKYVEEVTLQGDFDLTFWAIVSKVIDADFCQYTFFHSAYQDGKGNYSHIDNPQLDALLDEGRACIDPVRRKEIYAETCQIIKDESMMVPMYMAKRTLAANKDLVGLELRPDNTRRYKYASWSK